MTPRPVLTPVQVGALALPNRVVLAPLTRNRALDTLPNALMAEYYAQRASGGLLIAEATQIVPEGQGYPNTPGIHSDAQVAGWRLVTDAVHAKGGRIVLQLWHVGRISHPSLIGTTPIAPSAIRPAGQVYTSAGMQDYVTPRALETAELPGVVAAYVHAARQAKAAGFDAVEVHGANGYLLDQFLRSSTNHRTDAYGGSVENRARLLLEVVDAVVQVWGADRVGVRLSPVNPFNDISDADPEATFGYVASALGARGLAYLHVIEPVAAGHPMCSTHARLSPALKRAFGGTFIANGGYDAARADAAIAAGEADLISFGVPFLANPDLPARFAADAPLNAPDVATFYGGGAQGYTTYPALAG